MSRTRVTLVAGMLAAAMAFAQGGFDGPGRYEIMNLKSGKLMAVERDQSTVIQDSPRGNDSQRWDITPAQGGFFYIRNTASGRALQVSRNANSAPLFCNRFDGGSGQQWRFQPGKDGNALIVSAVRRTIDVPDGSDRDGVRLQIYDVNGDSNQRFILRRQGGFRPPDRDGGRDRDKDRGRDRDRDRDRN